MANILIMTSPQNKPMFSVSLSKVDLDLDLDLTEVLKLIGFIALMILLGLISQDIQAIPRPAWRSPRSSRHSQHSSSTRLPLRSRGASRSTCK